MNGKAEPLRGPCDPMYQWAHDLMPFPRSLSGPGVRATLDYLAELIPGLRILEAPTGAQAFDWTVPDEWTIHDAYVTNEAGERIVDFQNHNLHVVGYSEPVDRWMSLSELQKHLFSLPEQPDAIPYVTSYYERNWGFCMAHNKRQALLPGPYHAVINSCLGPGVLNYGEVIVSGETSKEVLLSTYICHPSMANDELSGPVVMAALVRWLQACAPLRLTFRILFLPETIGAIYYLSRHLDVLKANVIAGFVVSCVGDDRTYSMVHSRLGNTVADRVLDHVLRQHTLAPTIYSFLERGSDERQYCSPGVDLPVTTFSRSKFGTYPEYHTSLDDLSMINQAALEGSLLVLQDCVRILEDNRKWHVTVKCEPQLGRRGLHSTFSFTGSAAGIITHTMDFLAYADGNHDVVDIADRIGIAAVELLPIAKKLNDIGLIEDLSARGNLG